VGSGVKVSPIKTPIYKSSGLPGFVGGCVVGSKEELKANGANGK
jgi:hypothetical protein